MIWKSDASSTIFNHATKERKRLVVDVVSDGVTHGLVGYESLRFLQMFPNNTCCYKQQETP